MLIVQIKIGYSKDLSGDSEMCNRVKNMDLGTMLFISYSSSFIEDGEMYVFPLEISESN